MKLQNIIYLIAYIISFAILMIYFFKNLNEFIWIKLIMCILLSIIPSVIVGFLYIHLRRKTLKKELSKTITNFSKDEPKKIDKIFFSFAYLLFIPILIFIKFFPFLIGIPFVLAGLYSLAFGRIFTFSSGGLIKYFTGFDARIFGLIELILGLGISYILWFNFP